jgi:hypothetical protein
MWDIEVVGALGGRVCLFVERGGLYDWSRQEGEVAVVVRMGRN